MSEEEMEGLEQAEAVENKQRLKAAVHYAVGEICSQVEGTTFSREMVAVLTEATFRQAELLATDLELFAKHAKRTTVSVEDVKLCSRRNPSLLKILTEQTEKLREARGEQQKAGKERVTGKEGGEEVRRGTREEMREEEDHQKTGKEKRQKRPGKTRNRIIDSD